MPALSEWPWRSLADAATAIESGGVSPVELTRACLDRIDRLNPVIRAFVSVDADGTLRQAGVAEREIRAGRHRGSLHGVPIALKDKAQRLRRVLMDEVRSAFASVDVLATPSLPLGAWEVSESHVEIGGQAEHVLHACWRFTYPWNLTGLPALSVPCGFAAGRPAGVQLVGRPFEEALVLRVGHAYQETTRWHEMHPGDPEPQTR